MITLNKGYREHKPTHYIPSPISVIALTRLRNTRNVQCVQSNQHIHVLAR